MSHRNVYQKLGSRIAVAVQLLAEEKWIIEALNKIKQQRNSLQIERLHLENLKAQLKDNVQGDSQTQSLGSSDDKVTSSAVNLMQHVNSANVTCHVELDVVRIDAVTDEVMCNEEELNLKVSDPIFRKDSDMFDIEEEESDDDGDNVTIDINMLMHGEQDFNLR